MANRQLATVSLILGIVFANLDCTLGNLECEDLPIEYCAFSVASSGTRCVLEKYRGKDGIILYECQSSMTMAEREEEWIESDECIISCGMERISVGLSTDLLMDSHFTKMLCSSECLNNCPNLIDLYTSLAAGEGMYLPQLCKEQTIKRIIADPMKKATDEDYPRFILPNLQSDGAMAPERSPIRQSGAGFTPATGSRLGPDYPGYGSSPRGLSGGGGTVAPTSPGLGVYSLPPLDGVTIPPIQTAPAAHALASLGPSISRRPFFFASAPTPSPSTQSIPVVDTAVGSSPGFDLGFPEAAAVPPVV